MNQPVSLSTEMSHYITTGTCPWCRAVILSPEYVSQKREGMFAQVRKYQKYGPLLQGIWTRLVGDLLMPAGAKVRYSGYGELKCMTCMKTWMFYPPILQRPEVQQALQRISATHRWPTHTLYRPPVASPTTPLIHPTTPRPVTSINVANYQLIEVKDEQQAETVLRKETKTYPNESSARITPKVSITDSVTKSVTIEANKIKTSGTQTGVQILGFATIQGRIQQQLSQRYAVEIRRTLSVSEEVQIEVPPHSAIELSITWKLVWQKGTAVLGGTYSVTHAEVPYFIPHRLTFDWRTRDIPLTK